MNITARTPIPVEDGFTSPSLRVAYTGLFNGLPASHYHINGVRTQGWTSTSLLGDCCEYLDTNQALMNVPTPGVTLYLKSSSASDIAGSAGVSIMRIVYLDSFGQQRVRQVNMNGSTSVNLGGDFSQIQWMEAAAFGTAATVGAAGVITISSNSTTPTFANTFEYIRIGLTGSMSGRYTIPVFCRGYLLAWDSTVISASQMDVVLLGDYFRNAERCVPYQSKDRAYVTANTPMIMDLFDSVPAGATIKISAIPGASAAANKLEASFELIVVTTQRENTLLDSLER